MTKPSVPLFLKARKSIFEEISFHDNAKVLFVGVGTGADLELIKHLDLEITAIDLSADMLKKAMVKYGDTSITFWRWMHSIWNSIMNRLTI